MMLYSEQHTERIIPLLLYQLVMSMAMKDNGEEADEWESWETETENWNQVSVVKCGIIMLWQTFWNSCSYALIRDLKRDLSSLKLKMIFQVI